MYAMKCVRLRASLWAEGIERDRVFTLGVRSDVGGGDVVSLWAARVKEVCDHRAGAAPTTLIGHILPRMDSGVGLTVHTFDTLQDRSCW